MTFKILKKKNSELFGRIVTDQMFPAILIDSVIPTLYDKGITTRDIFDTYGIYIRDYDLVTVDLLTISM